MLLVKSGRYALTDSDVIRLLDADVCIAHMGDQGHHLGEYDHHQEDA